ncbi:branched-chain amino acid transport system II carrier protein [Aureibacter tunicatorum]|uniref:LIVCS family branched-chain amino acid:cation transporter n=1 Tax=Aureibacter tunicatorum TaxID=866807 RepID=A0AAE3XIW6_9BACT|nr:branched-chain amino acid transport system II carrier protein [Aureibacter tunicatorum]MDR6237245.1 LIVCS family branched-chain amino acid:cation transporter [Aureibacter tunicatorum]BDD06237.1 branched-chain amino acid transport system carrier protein [Aureibacter tunicatorum]
MKKKLFDVLTIGGATFAMFFGAGNLLFPPSVGANLGEQWEMGAFGFCITSLGLSFLAILGVIISGKDFSGIADKVGKRFSLLLATTVILLIGPFLAIPRTAATTFEIGVQPLTSSVEGWWISIIYFGLVVFFCINPKNIIDKIGKFLTPFLVVSLLLIIGKAFISSEPISSDIAASEAFLTGFKEGYQTLDAMAGIVFTTIIISALRSKGYVSNQMKFKMTLFSGGLAIGLLAFVYWGLSFYGASFDLSSNPETSRADILVTLVNSSLGRTGLYIFAIAVSAACFTTAIGLTSTVCLFFSKMFNGKVSYKLLVVVVSVLGAILSVTGVDNIVMFSGPVLELLYPTIIVLIFLNLFGDKVPANIHKGMVTSTLLFSVVLMFENLSGVTTMFSSVHENLPFAEIGLSWLVPAFVGGLAGVLLSKLRLFRVQ